MVDAQIREEGLDKVLEALSNTVEICDKVEFYSIDHAPIMPTFASKGKNTPFDGWEVKGEVCCTLADGKIVYEK